MAKKIVRKKVNNVIKTDERRPIYVSCDKCKKKMVNIGRPYKGKEYCQICYDDVRLRDEPKIKCAKCHNEVGSGYWSYYKGRKYCGRCAAIQQHDDAVAYSKVYRANLMAEKERNEKRKLIKPSPKSHFQQMSEDRIRVIQLIKERNK